MLLSVVVSSMWCVWTHKLIIFKGMHGELEERKREKYGLLKSKVVRRINEWKFSCNTAAGIECSIFQTKEIFQMFTLVLWKCLFIVVM